MYLALFSLTQKSSPGGGNVGHIIAYTNFGNTIEISSRE
jgi:hypothetical protein